MTLCGVTLNSSVGVRIYSEHKTELEQIAYIPFPSSSRVASPSGINQINIRIWRHNSILRYLYLAQLWAQHLSHQHVLLLNYTNNFLLYCNLLHFNLATSSVFFFTLTLSFPFAPSLSDGMVPFFPYHELCYFLKAFEQKSPQDFLNDNPASAYGLFTLD